MAEPAIIIGGPDIEGFHNKNLRKAQARLKEGKAYKDVSTIVVIPTRGVIPARVVESWWNLMSPMNGRLLRMFVRGMEVGDAYQAAVEAIQGNEWLAEFRYMLTMEEDNMPPPDGLLKLLENICDCKVVCKKHFSQVAGLYWTKGEGGQPMIYGDPRGVLAFQPQIPRANAIQECNGTGMGFTLFHMGLFKDPEFPKPWFKTVQEWSPQTGAQAGTQDLVMMGKIRKLGYRIASDNRVRVGHLDAEADRIW